MRSLFLQVTLSVHLLVIVTSYHSALHNYSLLLIITTPPQPRMVVNLLELEFVKLMMAIRRLLDKFGGINWGRVNSRVAGGGVIRDGRID